MLGAKVHQALRWWLFKVPSQSLATMPLLTITDLPFVIACPPGVYNDTRARLKKFQRNLTIHQWASLADIYPRNLMWLYAYLLFFWSRYCDVAEDLLAVPDRCLLAENFMRYICEMDSYVDSFDSRTIWRDQPSDIKNLLKVQGIARELCARLNSLSLPKPIRKTALRLILDYRRNAFFAPAQRWATGALYTFEDVLHDKEATAGNLWCTWCRLLNTIYAVPAEVAGSAARIIFNFGMVLQVIDDLGDAPVDYQFNAQNMFLALTRTEPAEWNCLCGFFGWQKDLFLDWPWIRKNIPNTYRNVIRLYYSYLDRIHAEPYHHELTTELYNVVERLRTLSG